ncbi:MAG: SGNH/GDSL hydrolase family protein [Clostridia bacterium]|nr:SGNH/GDSL hydrolase family protein [Clostridia bacterium]
MKQQEHNIQRKWLSGVMALILMVAMTMPLSAVSFAASKSPYDYNKDGKVVYTSLGDSIAGGFGLPDYNRYKQPLVYGKTIQGAYPTLLAKSLKADKFNPFAIPGMRSEDIAYLIGALPADDWVASTQFPNISGRTLSIQKLKNLRPRYQEAIRTSDVITLDIGFNDMWMPTIAGIYNIADYGNIFPADANKTILEKVDQYGSTNVVLRNATNYLAAWAKRPDKWAEFWLTWVSSFTKWCTDYMKNMELMALYIKTVNPKAKVIIPAKFNVFRGWDILPKVNDDTLEHLTQPLFDVYNLKARSICLRYGFTYVDASDAELASQDRTTIPLYEYMSTESGRLKFNPHPTLKGHKYIAGKLYKAIR